MYCLILNILLLGVYYLTLTDPDTFAPLGYGADVIIIDDLNPLGGTVWVTLTQSGKTESTRTAKAYLSEAE